MTATIDVRGLSCPLPVIKVKVEMDKGENEIEVIGDTPAARQNIGRLAANRGYKVTSLESSGGGWKLLLSRV